MEKHHAWKRAAAFAFALTVATCSVSVGSVLADDVSNSETALSEDEAEVIYSPVLTRVYTRLSEGFENYLNENSNVQGILYNNSEALSSLWYDNYETVGLAMSGYCIKDINNDGRSELITGSKDNNGKVRVYDIYTYSNGVIYHLASGGNANYIDILNDGRLLVSSTLAEAKNAYYFMNIGESSLNADTAYLSYMGDFYKAESFTTDADRGLAAEWSSISQMDYRRAMNNNQSVALDLISFGEFGAEDTAPSGLTSEEVYAPILTKVKMRVENGFSNYSEENNIIYGVLLGDQNDLSYLWYFDHTINLDNSGFAIADLNGDGRDELAIGKIDEDGNGTIFDLYTQYEDNYYHIAAAGERVHFKLTNRNTIVEEGSSGAASWLTIFYDIGRNVLEPSYGYSHDNGKLYKMESYLGDEATAIDYNITWKETDEEELSYAYQAIPFTAFSAIKDERVVIKANIEGWGQIEGTDNGLEPVFDDDYPMQSIAFNIVKGRPVKLIAKANEGYEFLGWKNAETNEIISTDTKLEFTAEAPLDLVAVFAERVLLKAGIEGMGQIAGADDGSAPVFDAEHPMQSVAYNVHTGKTVLFSAKPDDKWAFVCWRDTSINETYSESNTISIDVSEPLDLVAVFKPVDVSEHKISENALVKWSVNYYQDKNSVSANGKITGWSDEQYDITLSDENGNTVDTYSVDPDTGIGTDSTGEKVDLPQTGMSDINKAVAGLAALMTLGGLALVRRSGKENAE